MRFRYLRDPLFLLAVLLYIVNRWWWKPAFGGFFLHGYFNDLLLIPAALPPILWVHHKAGWRKHEMPPSFHEIASHLFLWAFIAEVVGPKLFVHSFGDWADAAAYTAGALAAGLWWHLAKARRKECREL
jgi:hypothetical protein